MHDYGMSAAHVVAKTKRDQITPAREIELLKAYRATGDVNVRNELLQGISWVAAVNASDTCRIRHRHDMFHDAFLEGQVALIESIDRGGFEIERGTRFALYAFTECKGVVQEYVHRNAGAVSEPLRTRVNGVSVYMPHRNDVSLDETVRDDMHSAKATFKDLLVADATYEPAHMYERFEITDKVNSAFNALSARDGEMLYRNYIEEEAMATIAGEHGVSGERVRQINEASIQKIRLQVTGSKDLPAHLAKPKQKRTVRAAAPTAA